MFGLGIFSTQTEENEEIAKKILEEKRNFQKIFVFFCINIRFFIFCEIMGEKEYADLGDAIKSVKNNQTIKLLQNVNYYKDYW